jgi:hypothetical protein
MCFFGLQTFLRYTAFPANKRHVTQTEFKPILKMEIFNCFSFFVFVTSELYHYPSKIYSTECSECVFELDNWFKVDSMFIGSRAKLTVLETGEHVWRIWWKKDVCKEIVGSDLYLNDVNICAVMYVCMSYRVIFFTQTFSHYVIHCCANNKYNMSI